MLLANHNEKTEKIRTLNLVCLAPEGRIGTTPLGTSLWQLAPATLTEQPILSHTCTDNGFPNILPNYIGIRCKVAGKFLGQAHLQAPPTRSTRIRDTVATRPESNPDAISVSPLPAKAEPLTGSPTAETLSQS
jgi:hypothetical protein